MANRKKSNSKSKDFNEESIEVEKHESEETNTGPIIGIVHNCLTNFKGVITESEGEEPNRHVVVKPKED